MNTQEDSNVTTKDLCNQVGNLMAENEELKDRLRNVESILANDNDKSLIDLKNYEKEQALIDKQNKYRF